MSEAACAKKILCRNKAQQLMVATCDNLDEWDTILSDELMAEVCDVIIKANEFGNRKAMKMIEDALLNVEPEK
jgi:hypothetical protein